jgi:dipeptide/tripeptide permease
MFMVSFLIIWFVSVQAILVVITARVMARIMMRLAAYEKDLHLLTLKFQIMSSLVMEP